ncbi:MAG: hypothetical protein BWY31_02756 [Lentisphaerae bacterium ADurb.Bin242]|nr:MAG: hypothetical protein BWY31_02756 [Lentisphaerae bacterium ADurb.Bin242]
MSIPSFDIRGFNLCETVLRHTPDQLRTFIRRMKHLGMNALIAHYDYGWKRYSPIILEECRKADVGITLMVFGPRTFLKLAGASSDLFAKNENGIPFTPFPECETQPCASSPEAVEAFGAGAEKWLDTLPPEIRRVHMRAGDGLLYCRCPKCAALANDMERFAPFAASFAKTVMRRKPDLEFETDIYCPRLAPPADSAYYHDFTYLMYDTFGRNQLLPLCSENTPCERDLFSITHFLKEQPDGHTAGYHHYMHLSDWCRKFPGKMYVHENQMVQGNRGLYPYNMPAMLADLRTYHDIGCKGVCYEAYEPGYSFYARGFEALARALSDIGYANEYEPSPLEKITCESEQPVQIWNYPDDFPFEKYIREPAELEMLYCFRRYIRRFSVFDSAEYMDLAFRHPDKFDPLWIGFTVLKSNMKYHPELGTLLDERERDLAGRRKLWDFMEEIPDGCNPIAETGALLRGIGAKIRFLAQKKKFSGRILQDVKHESSNSILSQKQQKME